ncbi:MAG: hypothetical protein KA747_01865 [Ignavibacteriaceae bacterium]|nr:hypothetical protein [Ignavibacteriaceae bacterium]
MNRVGKMANDFYTNLISGFAQGLGLGGQNHRIGVLKRGSVERENDALALFGELLQQEDAENGGVGDSTQTPQNEALLASIAPAIFSLYKYHRKKKGKIPGYDEPFLYYTDADGNRTWLDNGKGEKIKNSFYKPKIVDRFTEEKEGRKKRVQLYEDGSKVYNDIGEGYGKTSSEEVFHNPVEFQKKLLDSYRDGKISLYEYNLMKERGVEGLRGRIKVK